MNSTTSSTTLSHPVELALDLLYRMKRIRAVEEMIAERYSEGKMRCPTHLSTGQEAVPAAIGQVLRNTDQAVSTHRGHAHYMGKGGDIPRMIAEIYGKATGCSGGKGGSMHLVDPSVGFMGTTAIVGNSIPVGVGLALGMQLDGEDNITVIFLGDGAVEEGVFSEAANFAAVRKLPVLFVCENNMYSVYSSLRVRQPAGRKIHEMVRALGLVVEDGDGNDALFVHDTLKKHVAAIRTGAGPRFLEFSTYRWREHCGPNYDNDIGYRTEAEFLEWKKRDPIALLEAKLIGNGVATTEIEALEQRALAEALAGFQFAEDSEFPKPEEAYQHLFA